MSSSLPVTAAAANSTTVTAATTGAVSTTTATPSDNATSTGDQSASGDTSNSSEQVGDKRKRVAPRGVSGKHKELYSHFHLPHPHRKYPGKCTHLAVQCLYCLEAARCRDGNVPGYERVVNAVDIRRTPRCTQLHLDNCKHYKRHAREHETILSQVEAAATTVPGTVSIGGASTSSTLTRTPPSGTSIIRRPVEVNNPLAVALRAVRTLTDAEKRIFHVLCLELIVDNNLPFSFVECDTFRKIVEFLHCAAVNDLPHRRLVGGGLLTERSKAAVTWGLDELTKRANRGQYVGLSSDGWMNINKNHILAVVLTCNDFHFTLDSVQCGDEHHGIAVAQETEAFFLELAKEDDRYGAQFDVRYFCSDDAGQCARARRMLALRWPHMIFMKCFAHQVSSIPACCCLDIVLSNSLLAFKLQQVNLIVKELLTSPEYSTITKQATNLATCLSKSSSKWLKRLRDKMMELYGKVLKLYVPGDTRWNSLQACMGSILRCRNALEVLHVTYKYNADYPKDLLVLGDASFWTSRLSAEVMIRPLGEASFLMQRSGNTVAHVFLMLGTLARYFKDIAVDENGQEDILVRVRQNWCSYCSFCLCVRRMC